MKEASLFEAGESRAAPDLPRATRGLNAAQRAAVEHAAGPLIVLAGPGTGKTRVITHRIAHLVDSGIARAPESVVAVTYTVKAAAELRTRLAGMIGASTADRIRAHTLHGFGLRLLRRFGDLLDLPPVGSLGAPGRDDDRRGGRRCGLIDSAQARRMMRRIILDEDLFGHARAGGLEAIIDEAAVHFERFDNQGLAPADVRQRVEAWRTALGRGEDLGGRPLDAAERIAAHQRLERFADFARLHEEFDARRREAGLLTFGDLIMLPIRLLREHPRAAAIARSDYRHFLVDEFQDANAAQIELLRLLAPPGSTPDLCVVGDDDQSIYEFRGADDQAFRRFAGIWAGARTVELSENYRSRPRIVTVANSIISRAVTRFAPDKRIVCADPPSGDNGHAGPGLVRCVQLRDEKEDGEVIAAMIRVETGPEPEPGCYRRYAVVARTNNDLARVESALELEGIPTIRDRASSAAEDEGVQDVLAWARLVVNPREVWHARRLMLRPPVSASLESVNAWDQQYRAAASRWRSRQRGLPGEYAEDPGPLASWLAARPDAADDPAAGRFIRLFEQFSAAAASEHAVDMLVRIVRETGVVHADLLDETGRAERVANIIAMLNFAQARLERLPPPAGLREFLEYYDDLSERERGFEDGFMAERVDGSGDDAEDEKPDAVRLTTAHSAKGLEFDTVFVPRVNPGGYPTNRRNDRAETIEAVCVPATGEDDRADSLAEERRLFYVACTRAERRLVLLARKPAKSTTLNFFAELLAEERLRPEIEFIHAGVLLARSAQGAAIGGPGETGAIEQTSREPDPSENDGRLSSRDPRRRMIERERRSARLAAAAALTAVDRPDATPADLDTAAEALSSASGWLAAVAALEATGHPPAWASDRLAPEQVRRLETLAQSLAATAERGKKRARALVRSAWARQVPTPPLQLSFTGLREYERCPRCYYLRYVLGFEGPPSPATNVGSALHRALEKFYRRFRDADAAGDPPPGLDDMLRLARAEYFALAGHEGEVNDVELDRLLAQVRLGFERLHDPSTHVLETEREIRFEYTCEDEAGQPTTHRMEARLDRIDQVTRPDGTTELRIVDYKTGGAYTSLTKPPKDDLQMGIYALALRHEYGEDISGSAEYWLFSTGERGVLRLDEIDEAEVRARINGAVRGILAGHFEQDSDCKNGLCQMLGWEHGSRGR